MTALRARAAVLAGWRLIFLSTLLVAVGAFAASFAQHPVYQARTLVQLDIAATNFNVIVQQDKYVHTYVVLATSGPVLAQVAAHFPGVSAAQLARNVSASALQNSQLFEIDAQDGDAGRAAAIANDVAAVLIAQQLAAAQQDAAQAEQQVRAEIATSQDAINATQQQLATLKATRNPDPVQVSTLETRLSTLQTQVSYQEQSLAAIQLSKAESEAGVQVADPATPPATPIRPNRLINAGVGVALGLVLGLFVVLARAWRNQRVRDASAVGRLLECPVVAEGLASEAARGDDLRRLERQLAFLALEHPLRSLVIAGVDADEPAGAVAFGLATSAAQSQRRVLLVDANIAQPSQGERGGVPTADGLSDAVLAANAGASPEQLLASFTVAPAAPHGEFLRLLPAGAPPPNASQTLRSSAMRQVLEALLSSEADVVLVSAPPVLGTAAALARDTGTLALATELDGLLLVVELGRARESALLRARAALDEAGVRLVGCVVVGAVATRPEQAIPNGGSATAWGSVPRDTALAPAGRAGGTS
jgi:Mrp family chromosome partitioning ATPase